MYKITIKQTFKNYWNVFENKHRLIGYIEGSGFNTFTVQINDCYPKYFTGVGSLKLAKEFCLDTDHPLKEIKGR